MQKIDFEQVKDIHCKENKKNATQLKMIHIQQSSTKITCKMTCNYHMVRNWIVFHGIFNTRLYD